ncbi:MAG: serine/threonine-protein kinase [Planctomycetota bacterium]
MTTSKEELLERIADDFLTRSRLGDVPSIDGYCQEYPTLAEEIPKFIRTLELAAGILPQAKSSDASLKETTPPPERIAGYRIVEEIGRGGMGVVYAAEQESLNRRVALKVVPKSWLRDQQAIERFHREAQVTAKLHHTNIVPVFEVGEEVDYLFYAMQFIQGRSLSELIVESRQGGVIEWASERSSFNPGDADRDPRQPLDSDSTSTLGTKHGKSYRQSARIVMHAAEALAYAHSRGIIHRDIKPSNLLLDESDFVWVADFGAAKFDDTDLTATGDLLGTLRYMAPERFRRICDDRSDLYALGLTLYELLALRPAYETEDRLELVNAIKTASPPTLRSLDSRIPRDLETIVITAIEPDPERRYPSARAFAADLRRFLDDRVITARRPTPIEQLVRFYRRNQQLAASIGMIAVLLVLLLIGAISAAVYFRRGEERQRILATRAQAAEAAMQRNLYRSEMLSAASALSSRGGINQVERITEAYDPDNFGPDLRGWEWFYLRSRCKQESLNLDNKSDFVWAVDWHPGGEFTVTGDNMGFVRVWRVEDLKNVSTFRFAGQVWSVRWSPDGSRLAVGHGAEISVVDWTRETVIHQWKSKHQGKVERVVWSFDGKKLASAGSDGTIRVWHTNHDGELFAMLGEPSEFGILAIAWSPDNRLIASGGYGARTQVWEVVTGDMIQQGGVDYSNVIRDLSFSPDGAQLAIASEDRTIAVRDVADWGKEFSIFAPSAVYALAWSPDGSRLVSGNLDGTLRIYDPDTRLETKTIYGHSGRVADVAWNPNGKSIVSSADGGIVKFWSLEGPDDTLVPTTGLPGDRNAADWDNTGQRLAVAIQNKLVVWDSLTGPSREFVGHTDLISDIRWSPNGELIATSSYGEPARIWDVATGKTIQTLDNGAKDTFSVAWSADNRCVAVAHDGVLAIWEAATGRELTRSKDDIGLITSVDWNPHDDRIAVGGANPTVHIFSAKSSQMIAKLEGHSKAVECVRWSANGMWLASGSYDQSVRIWDVESSRLEHVLRGHERTIRSLAWHSSGDRLASGGGDAMLRIWDTSIGVEIVALGGHSRFIRAVDWTTDGRKIVTTSWDRTIRVWDATRAYQLDR